MRAARRRGGWSARSGDGMSEVASRYRPGSGPMASTQECRRRCHSGHPAINWQQPQRSAAPRGTPSWDAALSSSSRSGREKWTPSPVRDALSMSGEHSPSTGSRNDELASRHRPGPPWVSNTSAAPA